MKNQIKTTCILFFTLVFFLSCNSKKNEVWSEWQLQNRADNTYLYDDNGVCKNGIEPKDDSYKWIVESADEYVRIKNKKTGRYLHFDDNSGKVDIINADSTDHAIQWKYGGYDWDHMKNCGWYNIHNRIDPDKFLSAGSDVNMKNTDINSDFSAHWTFIRIAGSTLPFEIEGDFVKEASFMGMREARYVSDDEVVSNYHKEGNRWERKLDVSQFPQLKADNHKLLVALYRMSLEEMQLDIRKQDSTFQAGALWLDTWTRDAVYAIHLAYGMLLPEVSRKTLEKQTLQNPREALQDTGSGGSWPISTDRVVWAIAAWEYYLATGDKNWLEYCYEGLSYTAEKDIHVAFDNKINLFKGETCSMDWRTHTYPNWYTNVTIGESYSSGTNALHAFMYDFLTKAGNILGKPQAEVDKWNSYSGKVKKAINDYFWMPDKGYYSAYMNPRLEGYNVSQRGGCMSSGLNMIFGVADDKQCEEIAARFPLYPYGAPTLYPSIPDDFAYHNKSVWPVWESYYMLGAHKAGNLEATGHIMKSIARQAGLFLTNKENMTYDTGFDVNTALNSDRQLWSVAAYLGMFYKVIFGMDMTTDGLRFTPAVPDGFFGPFELQNFKYRKAVLDIQVKGTGNVINKVLLDGKEQAVPFILPADITGKHSIEIEVKKGNTSKINLVEAGPGKCWSSVEPVLIRQGDQLVWEEENGLAYMLWDGKNSKEVKSPIKIDTNKFGVYNLFSVNQLGFESDLSNPVIVSPDTYKYEAEDSKNKGKFSAGHPGFSGKGFIADLAKNPADLTFRIQIPEGKSGNYVLNIVGANGHGPDQTYCMIRSVFIDGKDVGTFILEASGDWNKWLSSNYIFADNISEGEHTIQIVLNPEKKGWDSNMSRNKENANDGNIDYLELKRIN